MKVFSYYQFTSHVRFVEEVKSFYIKAKSGFIIIEDPYRTLIATQIVHE